MKSRVGEETLREGSVVGTSRVGGGGSLDEGASEGVDVLGNETPDTRRDSAPRDEESARTVA